MSIKAENNTMQQRRRERRTKPGEKNQRCLSHYLSMVIRHRNQMMIITDLSDSPSVTRSLHHHHPPHHACDRNQCPLPLMTRGTLTLLVVPVHIHIHVEVFPRHSLVR